jgi:geranylgeranyl diphosphate synthase type I
VDDALRDFLRARRQELAWIDPDAVIPVDEIARLLEAGGKRIRPVFCYWGYRAAGGADGPDIIKAAAALELLHTMAIVHDDLMDDSKERRGVPTTHVHLGAEDEYAGWALAILTGDVAAVLADQLFLGSALPAERLIAGLDRYHRMRLEMAAGQLLDVTDVDRDHNRVAKLKGGSYTVEGPLLIGAALGGAGMQLTTRLQRFGEPLGLAFQMHDDLRDGEAVGLTLEDVQALVERSKEAIDPESMDLDAAEALASIAETIAIP